MGTGGKMWNYFVPVKYVWAFVVAGKPATHGKEYAENMNACIIVEKNKARLK